MVLLGAIQGFSSFEIVGTSGIHSSNYVVHLECIRSTQANSFNQISRYDTGPKDLPGLVFDMVIQISGFKCSGCSGVLFIQHRSVHLSQPF